MPFAYIAMTIRSLDVARAYDIVKIMTDGGPACATTTIVHQIYLNGFRFFNMGYASAQAWV